MKRLFVVEVEGWVVVAAEDAAEARYVAETALRDDALEHLDFVSEDELAEGDPLPGIWSHECLFYGAEEEGDVTIEQFFARQRAERAAAAAFKPDPAAAVADLFEGVPPLPKGAG